MLRTSLFLCCLLAASLGLFANQNPPEDSTKFAEIDPETLRFVLKSDSIYQTIDYQTGKIALPGGKVALNIPADFKFIDADKSKLIIVDIWGNPPTSAENVLGMIVKDSLSMENNSDFAFVISFDAMGFVKDDDAAKIDYDDLLVDMQKEEVEVNKERAKIGYGAIHTKGWAQKPFYDKEHKVLHWAKELQFEGSESSTLNYDVRVLGRHGVLSMNAVGGMEVLPEVNKNIDNVLKMATFTEGNTYRDFDPKIDNVAAWTIGGLVAGKILTKVGFFAILLKFWKLIMLGIIGVFGAIRRFFTGKKKKSEPAADDAAATEEEHQETAVEAGENHPDTQAEATGENTGNSDNDTHRT